MIKSNQALVTKSSNNLWVYYTDNKGSARSMFLVDRVLRTQGHSIPTGNDFSKGRLFDKAEVASKLNVTFK